jgi:uncharacterized surface protein with fasciclin (FAS1) repeats
MSISRRRLLAVAASAVAVLALAALANPVFAKGSAKPAPAPKPPPPPKPKDLLDVLGESKDPTFKTFLDAVKAADLTATLKGKGPFTLFVPTDNAFLLLGDDKVAELMKPENKAKLKGILNHHVAAGKLMAADVAKLKEIKTASGTPLKVEVAEDKSWTVDGVAPVKNDVVAANGVMYFVNKILMPPEPAPAPTPPGPTKPPPPAK